MTEDAVKVVEMVFTTVWNLFVGFNIPGTNVTPAAMAIFLLAASFGFRFFISWCHSMPGSEAGLKARAGVVRGFRRVTARKDGGGK